MKPSSATMGAASASIAAQFELAHLSMCVLQRRRRRPRSDIAVCDSCIWLQLHPRRPGGFDTIVLTQLTDKQQYGLDLLSHPCLLCRLARHRSNEASDLASLDIFWAYAADICRRSCSLRYRSTRSDTCCT